MGLKQQQADSKTDPKKRRRVAFAGIDAGVEASECIKIYLVSSKEEVGASSSFTIDPVDLNQFFDDDGKIYGYQELKINIWVSSISFHAFADITYQSTSDGGKGITDLKSALQRIFAENLVEDKDEFFQTFSTESQYIGSILSNGEVLQQKAIARHVKDHLESEAEASVEVIRTVAGNMEVGHLYCRLVPLVLLLVDGSNPIDVTDPKWEIYLVVEKNIDHDGGSRLRLLGFSTVYRFYHYPDSCRLRLSQILVLPPYQHKGYGRYLLEALNSVAISENVYDTTVEDPLDYFQHVRTCVDTLRLLNFDLIQQAVNSVTTCLKEEKLSKKTQTPKFLPSATLVEDVRKFLKINKKQFLQCWYILVYLGLNPIDKYMENYEMLISDHMKASLLEKDYGTGGKRLIEVPSDYDQEMSFIMFKSGTGNGSAIEVDESQTNQAEQLQKLIDEKMEEIKLIAHKVSLHRS